MTEPILELVDLSVSFAMRKGEAEAVRKVSFEVNPGEILAIVGESGSGKSVTALGLLGLLPRTATVTGSARFKDEDLLAMSAERRRQVRGSEIAMIFQDPMTAFNPVYTIGYQIAEAIRIHRPEVSKKDAMADAAELLDKVGVPEAKRRVHQYPHEFSGGMRQRAMIAMAICNSPDLLIADEPTTALDVTIQAQVMEVLKTAQDIAGSAMILITHDLALVAGVADRIVVMYGGRVFETADTRTMFYNPMNPYTRGLLGSIPRMTEEQGVRLSPIPGTPPSILAMPKGCAFAPRCTFRDSRCAQPPPLVEISPDHLSRCHRAHELPAVVVNEPSVAVKETLI